MSGFSANWLRLREPVDAAARAAVLEPLLRAAARPVRPDASVSLVDLGAGTGANLRFLAPRIGGDQDWLLLEQDSLLIDTIAGSMSAWAKSQRAALEANDGVVTIRNQAFNCRIRVAKFDLSADIDDLSVPEGALVTASALLDLVSENWLRQTLRLCARANATMLFALSYDGTVSRSPTEAGDAEALDLFNVHQKKDKGFGPALGPAAAAAAVSFMQDLGYQAESASSPWRLGPADRDIQRALLEGWFAAACEMTSQPSETLMDWVRRRKVHIETGRSEMIVGHRDVLGFRPAG